MTDRNKLADVLASDDPSLLQQYGVGYQSPALGGDDIYGTSDALRMMNAANAPKPWFTQAMRHLASFIPVDDRESGRRGRDESWPTWWARTNADGGGGSAMAAWLKAGLGETVPNWLDWGNKTRPEDYSGGDTLAPLGMAGVGSVAAKGAKPLPSPLKENTVDKLSRWGEATALHQRSEAKQGNPYGFAEGLGTFGLSTAATLAGEPWMYPGISGMIMTHPKSVLMSPHFEHISDIAHYIREKDLREARKHPLPDPDNSGTTLYADSSRASLPGTLVNALAEQPVSAATKYGDRVFAAPVHGLEEGAAVAALGKERVQQLLNSDAAIRGFVTNLGRFVTREEAAALAKAADPNYKPRGEKWADSSNFISDKDLAGLDPSLRKVIEQQRAAAPSSVFGPRNTIKADNEFGSVPGTLVNALSEQGKPTRIDNPIRAYHGMAGELEGGKFDPARFGQHHPEDRSGVFLTTNPEAASGWAEWASSRSPREAIGDNAAVVPADAHFKNPLEVQSRNYDPSQHWYDNRDALLATAQRGGHDGIIVRQPHTGEATLVALQPGTVKSALTGKTLYGLAPALMGPALVNALSGETGRGSE